jgi:hypothetical protein
LIISRLWIPIVIEVYIFTKQTFGRIPRALASRPSNLALTSRNKSARQPGCALPCSLGFSMMCIPYTRGLLPLVPQDAKETTNLATKRRAGDAARNPMRLLLMEPPRAMDTSRWPRAGLWATGPSQIDAARRGVALGWSARVLPGPAGLRRVGRARAYGPPDGHANAPSAPLVVRSRAHLARLGAGDPADEATPQVQSLAPRPRERKLRPCAAARSKDDEDDRVPLWSAA